MKAITHTGEALTENYVLGALSCIIWTLTLQTTIKYVLIALRADNHGEGGILALYALLRRHKRRWIYAIAVIGASTLLADGVITPAITITTAIEGLRGINPDIPVLPVAIAVITVVFFVQRFGTEHVGRSFGTFMLLWFMLLGVVGLMWLIGCPQVLKAFNPYYAARLLIESPVWFLVLGAVFLCTTGAEALYSDLGHCGKHNIAISWTFCQDYAHPQLSRSGCVGACQSGACCRQRQPIFMPSCPTACCSLPCFMATGAAIVASQALISGSFSILSEAMNLNFWAPHEDKAPYQCEGDRYIFLR